jgi:hypothetical protein
MTTRTSKAVTWVTVISLCLEKDFKLNYSEYDDDLAAVMKKAKALRLAATIACEEAAIDLDELIVWAGEYIDKNSDTA